jgi:hypothetical protein
MVTVKSARLMTMANRAAAIDRQGLYYWSSRRRSGPSAWLTDAPDPSPGLDYQYRGLTLWSQEIRRVLGWDHGDLGDAVNFIFDLVRKGLGSK